MKKIIITKLIDWKLTYLLVVDFCSTGANQFNLNKFIKSFPIKQHVSFEVLLL